MYFIKFLNKSNSLFENFKFSAYKTFILNFAITLKKITNFIITRILLKLIITTC